MSEIPEWLRPYCKQGAYTPNKEDIESLEPQSRKEMLLKYLTDSVSSDLSNYYTKSEVDNLISAIPKFDIKVVQTLPSSDISPTTVYLVPSDSESSDIYKEYIYVNTNWELLGIQKSDLLNYYNKTEINNLLSDKVNFSDLSTVATSGSYNDLSNKPTIPTKNSDLTNDSNFVSSSDLSNNYYNKTQTDNLLDTKVDKVTGKGLSTEDYTTAEKTKLAGIESEANKTVVALYNTTLSSSGWSSNAPYTQTLSIQGILATDVPVVDVVLSSTTSTAVSQLEAWGYVSKIETADGSITATCFEELPAIDIPIQLKVVR